MKNLILLLTMVSLFSNISFANEKDLISSNKILSNKILGHYATSKNASENVLISTKNINDALALLLAGAGDDSQTLHQLKDLFNGSEKNTSDILFSIKTMNDFLTQEREATNEWEPTPTKIKLDTSLWANSYDGFQFSEKYKNITKLYLNSEVQTLAFNKPETKDTINTWVSEATEGMIPKLIEELPASLSSLLISTLFIEGAWRKQFNLLDEARNTFYLADGNTKKHQMMSRRSFNQYYENEDYQSVKISTADQLASIEIFLPKESSSMEDLRENFLNGMIQNEFVYKNMILTIPKFKVGFKENAMEAILKPIIPNSFTGSNFLNMSSINQEVTKIIHQTVLEVNEKGFKAAAATGIMMERTSVLPTPQKTMTVDRPFGIKIMAKTQNNEVELFRGWIANPEKL